MRNLRRWIVLSQLLVLGQSFMAAAPPAAKGVDVVLAYAGVWKVEMEHFDTARSKAGHEKTTLRNACWHDGAYVACNQYVDGDSKILLVFTYNAAENIYTSYQIPAGGADPGSGKLLIDGNVWTFPWQVTEDGNTTYFRVVNVFLTPDKIESRQEFSVDKVHWTLTAKALETRVSGA